MAIDVIGMRAMGDEPFNAKTTFNVVGQTALITYLNWYNYFKDGQDAKRYILDANPNLPANKVRQIPDAEVKTVGWIFRLIAQGFTIADETVTKIKKQLDALIVKYEAKTAEDVEAAEIEKLMNRKVTAAEKLENAKWVLNYFTNDPHGKRQANAAEMIAGAKKVLNVKPEINPARVRPVLADDKPVPVVANKKRAVRMRKPIPTVRIVAKCQYQKVDADLNIQSLKPAELVGATEIWLYNTELRTMFHYVAEKNSVMSVKGTTIIGYDKARSTNKNIRKPDVTITQFMGTNKTKRLAFYQGIKAVAKTCKGRMNNETLILKTVK